MLPETAAASALTGFITDPRTLDMPNRGSCRPRWWPANTTMLVAPWMRRRPGRCGWWRNPKNITTLPDLGKLGPDIRVR